MSPRITITTRSYQSSSKLSASIYIDISLSEDRIFRRRLSKKFQFSQVANALELVNFHFLSAMNAITDWRFGERRMRMRAGTSEADLPMMQTSYGLELEHAHCSSGDFSKPKPGNHRQRNKLLKLLQSLREKALSRLFHKGVSLRQYVRIKNV